jgi:tetratricopeptide (TPR) repeat protein
LQADLCYMRAIKAYQTARKDEFKKQLEMAVAEYRKAESIKPGQQGVEMQLAHALAASNDFAGAEQLYHQVIDHDSKYQYAYTELYKLDMLQNRPDDGEKVLKQAIQNNPKQYAFLTALALHYSMLHRRDDMIGVLQQIKSHAKDFSQAYLVVGDFYLRLGDGDSAVREYREGIQKDPKQKATYQKRSIEVLMRQGKRNEAAEVMQQILKDNPQDNDAKGLEATFLLDKGDVARALSELQAVVTRAPDNPVARYNLGRAHAARAEWEQARQMFQKAIELRPDYIIARLALAQLEVSRGEFDAALKASAQILAIDRNNINARLIESAALMGQKKFGDSRQLLENMLKVNTSSPDVLFQLGVVNLAENKFKDANDAFRKAYELNPANPRGLMGMVETDMAQNKTEEALNLLRTESAKAPTRMDLVLQLGNMAVRAGKYDDAIGYFQKVLEHMDKNARARGDMLMRIGETYRRKGDLQSAVANLQKAREVLPDNVVILSTLALVLDSAGRWTEAQAVYQATLKMDPNNGVSLNNVAFLMAEHGGDLDSALTLATKAKQMLPNLSEVSDTLGWIYLKKGMPDNAIESFRELVAKEPHAATYRYHLGMALLQKGDKPNALRELQTALKDNPAKAERDKIQEMIQKIG